MEDVTLLLYLKDVEYGKRLLRFLVQKKNPGLHPELVTSGNGMEFRIGMGTGGLVILTDDPTVHGDEKRKVINLSNVQDRTKGKIFQFQKAEKIYQEILWQCRLEEKKEPAGSRREEISGQEKIFVVFSPNAADATEFSVILSQYMAQGGRCLYLQLSGFPVYSVAEPEAEVPLSGGMGDLMFMLEQEDFAERAGEFSLPFGRAEMLPPFAHFKDLLDCRPEDWKRFLERLQKECGYDSIIVEMGQVFEHFLDLMERADRILFLQVPGVMGRVQRAVFRRFCHTEKKEDLLKRIRYVRQPEDFRPAASEWGNVRLEELTEDGRKMQYVKQALGIGGEGDDIIMEDTG